MEWCQYLHPTVAGEELTAEALGDAVRGILRQVNREFSVSVLSFELWPAPACNTGRKVPSF